MRKGSTVTQWRALAEAFSHKPTELGYDDNGIITHNGKRKRIYMFFQRDHVLNSDLKVIYMMCQTAGNIRYIVMQKHFFWGYN